MKRFIGLMALFFVVMVTACSKNDATKTEIEVTVKENNQAVENIDVYVFTSFNWKFNGCDTDFMELTASTNSEGKVVFNLNEVDGAFEGDGQDVFYFCAKYFRVGNPREASASITAFNGRSDEVDIDLN